MRSLKFLFPADILLVFSNPLKIKPFFLRRLNGGQQWFLELKNFWKKSLKILYIIKKVSIFAPANENEDNYRKDLNENPARYWILSLCVTSQHSSAGRAADL